MAHLALHTARAASKGLKICTGKPSFWIIRAFRVNQKDEKG